MDDKTDPGHRPAFSLLFDVDLIHTQIIEANPSGIILVDALLPDRPILYVNAAFERMTGYSREEVMGINCRFLQGEDREQEGRAVIRTALDRGESCTVTLRNYRKDGTLFWNELRIAPLHDDLGRVTHFIGIQNDITTRKQAEEALLRKHAELESFFTLSLDLMCIAHIGGRFIKLNQAWEQILGYKITDLEGKFFLDLVHPDDRPATLQVLATVSQQPSAINFTNRYLARDGQYHIIEWHSQSDGDLIYAAARDVTRRRQSEETLRQSEALLNSILTSQSTFVVRTDMQGYYTYVNEAIFERFRWRYARREDMLGAFSLDSIIPEDHALVAETVETCIRQPGQSCQVMLRKLTEDGGVSWVLWEFLGITDDDGKVSEIQCVGIDVTERKEIEEREFEIALERERLRLLTAFIQNISHEFRTPLTVMNSSAHLMTRITDPDQLKNKEEQIDKQVQRITRLIDLLLMAARLEYPDALVYVQVDLNQLIVRACDEIDMTAEDMPSIQTQPALALPVIHADYDYMVQAVRDIIEAACRLAAPTSPIKVATGAAADVVWVEIDSGTVATDPGALFDSFWQQDQVHAMPGVGLGLSIARKIIEVHGGGLTWQRRADGGGLFRVTLPIMPADGAGGR